MVKEVDGANEQVYGVAVTKQLRYLARDTLARRQGASFPARGTRRKKTHLYQYWYQ